MKKATTGRPATKIVFVKAVAVHLYGNGLAGVEVPVSELGEKEREIIKMLFPYTADHVYDLLDKEAVLAAMDVIDASFEPGSHRTYTTVYETTGKTAPVRVPSYDPDAYRGDDDETP